MTSSAADLAPDQERKEAKIPRADQLVWRGILRGRQTRLKLTQGSLAFLRGPDFGRIAGSGVVDKDDSFVLEGSFSPRCDKRFVFADIKISIVSRQGQSDLELVANIDPTLGIIQAQNETHHLELYASIQGSDWKFPASEPVIFTTASSESEATLTTQDSEEPEQPSAAPTMDRLQQLEYLRQQHLHMMQLQAHTTAAAYHQPEAMPEPPQQMADPLGVYGLRGTARAQNGHRRTNSWGSRPASPYSSNGGARVYMWTLPAMISMPPGLRPFEGVEQRLKDPYPFVHPKQLCMERNPIVDDLTGRIMPAQQNVSRPRRHSYADTIKRQLHSNLRSAKGHVRKH